MGEFETKLIETIRALKADGLWSMKGTITVDGKKWRFNLSEAN